jgi:hypothetical protein
MLEGQVFQFLIQVVEPQPIGDGSIDVQSLLGDAALLLRAHHMQGAHVVEAVGQLDQDDAHVACHCQQHLAEILGLRLGLVLELDLVQLGDAIHQSGHRLAEFLGNLGGADAGIFHHVMQQGGDQGLRIELPFGQDFRHGQGMGDVRPAILAELA